MQRGSLTVGPIAISWRCDFSPNLCRRLLARATGYENAAARIRQSSRRDEIIAVAERLEEKAGALRQDVADFAPWSNTSRRRVA